MLETARAARADIEREELAVKIAAVQHRLRDDVDSDIEALIAAARKAADEGADVTFMPEPLSLFGAGDALERFHEGLVGLPGVRLIPSAGPSERGFAATAPVLEGLEGLGRIALLAGDACMTGLEIVKILGDQPWVAVLAPRSESDLQAEAMLELAIAFSESLAGLIVVTECAGAEPGVAGHGGTVIVHLGKILAESVGDDDEILYADVVTPVPQPEPREALPSVPPLLAQRLAHHRGEKVQVDYLADLS